MLDELQKSLEDKGLHFTWDEDVEDYLVKKSYSATYGARNLRRTIQKELEDVMEMCIRDSSCSCCVFWCSRCCSA